MKYNGKLRHALLIFAEKVTTKISLVQADNLSNRVCITAAEIFETFVCVFKIIITNVEQGSESASILAVDCQMPPNISPKYFPVNPRLSASTIWS